MGGVGVEVFIEQDPGSAGKQTIAHYKKNILFGYAVKEVPRGGSRLSKGERGKPFSSHAQDGNVYLIRGHWVKALLDELELVPDSRHDDQYDCCAGAFQELAGVLSVEPRIRWV